MLRVNGGWEGMLSITSHDDQRVNNFPPLRQSKISANPEAIAMTTNQFKSKKKKDLGTLLII